jgi:hypothetical protein
LTGPLFPPIIGVGGISQPPNFLPLTALYTRKHNKFSGGKKKFFSVKFRGRKISSDYDYSLLYF